MLKKITHLDKKRLYIFINFYFVPPIFIYFYNLKSINFYKFSKFNFVYLYTGKYWKICFLSKWRIGLSFYSFVWFKQIAIYKKKQYLKKKKK